MGNFNISNWVVITAFPEHPAMRVIGQLDNKIECRYTEKGILKSGFFYAEELEIRAEEVPPYAVIKDDYVRFANLQDAPVMIVVHDHDNNETVGCRYIVDGVIHYHEFRMNELVRLSDDEVDEYQAEIPNYKELYSNN